ncbi:MAG: sodium:proline symporter, partial [Bdellovibrionales bacterium]
GKPNFNLAVPVFVIKYFPVGLVGLVMVGLFSAAMSSLDSTINSLSATTMQDVMKSYLKMDLTSDRELWYSKVLTVFWGTVCTLFAFYVGDISDSIIVSINKVGSLANGPILGVFLLGIFTTRATGRGAIAGLVFGFVINLSFWLFIPQVSWPWWNMIGCVVCFFFGYLVSMTSTRPSIEKITGLTYASFKGLSKGMFKVNWKPYYWFLVAYGILITGILASL